MGKVLIIKRNDLTDEQRNELTALVGRFEIPHLVLEENVGKCFSCGKRTGERKIAFFADMARALHKVWKWCQEKNVYEFNRKDIKHLFTNENQSARFGDWILFGGLVYRPAGTGKGEYGLNVQRVEDFFANKLQIPTMIVKTKDSSGSVIYLKSNYKLLKDLPELLELLTPLGQYKMF